MHSEILKYEVNGLQMESVLYFDESKTGKRPAVVVFPEGFGISEHTREKARQVAELGYVALASDLFGNSKTVDKMEDLIAFIGPMMEDPLITRRYAQAGLDALTARPEVDASKVAAIGYCFGGTTALELARSGAAVQAVAGFHSGLGTARPGDAKDIKGKVLVCIGADDPLIDRGARQSFVDEMTAGKADWQMHLYGGVVHSFTNKEADARGQPNAIRYSPDADKRSWESLVDLLKEVFA